MKHIQVKGPALMLMSSFLFAIMGVFVKLASVTLPAEEIALVRFLFGVVVCLPLAYSGTISLASEKKTLLAARGVFGGLAILLYFTAIGMGSLTNAVILNNTHTIFATLLAIVYLQEKPGRFTTLALGISFAGVLLLTHPDFRNIRLADLLGLSSGILAGAAIVVVRALRKTESAWSVFFYLSFFGAGFSALLALPKIIIPSWQGGVYMLLGAVFGMAAQVAMTVGYKYCTAAVGSVLSISTALFATLFGLLFLGESLTLLEGAGALAILVGSVVTAFEGSRANEAAIGG